MISMNGAKKLIFTRYQDYPQAIWMELRDNDGAKLEVTIHIPVEDFAAQLRHLASILETNAALNKDTKYYTIEETKDAPVVETQTT